MKYKNFSASDFANDSFFIRWVKHPDEESDWFWTSFMEENPGCKPAMEAGRELISLFDFSRHDLGESAQQAMRIHLLMSLRADREARRDHQFVTASWSAKKNAWRLAAAILIIAMAMSGIYFYRDSHDDTVSSRVKQTTKEIENRVNPIGQKSVFFLSDGTKVWVNAASRITYVKDFKDQKTRDVYLEGEAFFDVAHQEGKPFIVHTSSIKIKVLGTSFNVKSYSEEKTVETTLVRGTVRIEQSDLQGNRIADVELKPNQRAVFNKASKIIHIKEVVADHSASWRQERLVFDEESIDNVILQMERWYDVKIHAENRGNLDCRLTASIEKESLEEVLKLMEISHDIHYMISGREVFIKGTFCH